MVGIDSWNEFGKIGITVIAAVPSAAFVVALVAVLPVVVVAFCSFFPQKMLEIFHTIKCAVHKGP